MVEKINLILCMCVCVDEDLQGEEELDKELLWNLQLLSEVRVRMCMCM